MPGDLYIDASVTIPGSLLSWTAVRSSGPGGQNVNKVSTKVDLRFDVDACEVLGDRVKARLRAACRLDQQGRIVIVSQATRNRLQNLTDARRRLAERIAEALIEPKKRRPTRPSRGAERRRLEQKRKVSEKKRDRRAID